MPVERILSPVDVVGPPAPSAYEKERGKPTPSRHHAIVQSRLLRAFLRFPEFDILPELTLGFPDRAPLTPDLSVYPCSTPDWSQDEYPVLAMPRTVVEIVASSQTMQEMVNKAEVYFAHGAESARLVLLATQTIFIGQPGILRPLVFA